MDKRQAGDWLSNWLRQASAKMFPEQAFYLATLYARSRATFFEPMLIKWR